MDLNLNLASIDNSNAKDLKTKVLILGSGPAGLSAALYAARADLQPIVLTGIELGGQAALTFTIENYPGFPEGVNGSQLGELFQKQAEKFGARIEMDSAEKVDLSKRPFTINTTSKIIVADSLIITTGATPNHLGIPGEKEFTGKGVSYCATCDGYFFKNKKVAVVGGGDSALEEAIFLTRFADSVTIIHRRDELRAGTLLQKRAKENPKISFFLDTIPLEIQGTDKINGVLLKNVKTQATRIEKFDGVFIFIGHTPNSDLFKDQIELDDKGYIKIDMLMRTNIPGVFAAGEVADPNFRQVVTSAGMGAAAAIQAGKFLEGE